MGFRDLRVINEDVVIPGEGFGTHGHRDMEIVTYVLSGALEHKDSMGTGSVLHYGDVQRMSAGKGVTHSEFNASQSEPVHLLQIWILPDTKGIKPSYEEKHFEQHEKRNTLRLIASKDGENGSVRIHQSARIYASILESQQTLNHTLRENLYYWLQLVRGELNVNTHNLMPGDAAYLSGETLLQLNALTEAEFLLFELK